MYKTVDRYAPATWAEAYDEIIDVRSPSEFAEDHVPGAVNLPVLSDAERAEVGTIYVQVSKFQARRLGAALVASNIGRHLQDRLQDRPGGWRPLVYCWRGGMRSASMAQVLSQVGWRTAVLTGGYATYRRQVVEALYGEPLPHRLVLLAGHTGVAKTEMLARLAARGVQTLDLEGLARHRGSLFGARPGEAQPSQKLFETRLWAAVQALDPARPVVVEAESSKIGELALPPALWSPMQAAPHIELQAPDAARADYLASAYDDVAADPAALYGMVERLPGHLGKAQREAWRGLIDAKDWRTLALSLIREHYDPAYARTLKRDPERRSLGEVAMATLLPADQEGAAGQIARLVEAALA
jgi:tRNA 2-selenouridine synthase